MDSVLLPCYRDEFLLDPAVHFLNHGSFGATPRPVFESCLRWQREMERQPVEFLGRRADSLLLQSRQALAGYLHTVANNLVYVTNATTGLNIIAHSLRLSAGDEVLSSEHEYGALDRTWRFLSKKSGFTYTNRAIRLPLTTAADFVEQFWSGVTSRTRVIFLSHITSPTALIFPVKDICARARQSGILTIIDGAHAPGQIPLDLDDLGADFYSGNLHKWLCAPKGAAFLYAHPSVQHLVEPLIVSWGWDSSAPGPVQWIDYLEWSGTRDISAFLTVPDAIQFQQTRHWEAVRQACHILVSQTQKQIAEITGIPPFHIDSPLWYAQMGAAPLPHNTDIDHLKTELYDLYKIEIPLIQWQSQPLIRFSYQAYNSPQDMDCLLSTLRELL